MLQKLLALALSLTLCAASLTGCDQQQEQETPQDGSSQTQTDEARPETAIKRIYSTLEISSEHLVNPTQQEVTDLIGLDMEDVEEYYIRWLDPDFGASNVYIVKPREGEEHKENVLNALKEHRDDMIRKFENYDVFDSTAISENALLFERGGYVVMLMLADNDTARTIIERYIPEKLEL